jgi:hypothetical protein
MTTVLPFANNTIQVFAYEGFDYTLSNPNPSLTLQTVSNTPGLDPKEVYFTKNGNTSYKFAVSDTSSTLTAGTTETFTLNVVDGGGVVYRSSNTVSIGPGRFLDASGNSLSNNSYTFYKNEPITPIHLEAPSFRLRTPTANPSLPPGLSFVSNASNIFLISGTPTVTVPNSNYQIIGVQQGGSKVVTTRFNMVVSNERLRLDLSGASIINDMEIGVQIEPRVITAIPPSGTSTVRYTFPAFPDGIVVTDRLGDVKTTPFVIQGSNDPSYTFILSGTPTEAAAYTLKNIVGGTAIGDVQAARTVPTPVVENSQEFSFRFKPTILFDQSTVPQLYTNIAFDPSSIFFRAQTYFTSNIPITSIFSPDLRSDLSLVFVPSESRAYLKGNPIQSTAGSANYTIRAIDAALNERDYSVLINVVDDSVSFSSPVGDVCLNYILSRPVDSFKPGYYTSNVQFKATSLSRLPVTLSAPALTGTGLFLDSNGVIVGIPTSVTPLTDLVVTASVTGSPATATKTIKFAILNDVFRFTDVSASSLAFIQNVPITPFRFPVSTLSDRNVVNYSQIGFPDGLTINPAGIVSGTPTSSSPTTGNVTINATTGYASGSCNFTYTLIPDSMLFVVPQTTYAYIAGDSVGPIDINGVTFSGTTVSNYDLSISPTYGMTLNASNGILSGTWTTGIPPQTLLPSSCNFAVTAKAGGLTGVLPMTFTASPVVENAMMFVGYGNPTGEPSDFNNWLYSTTPSNVTSFSSLGVNTTDPIVDIGFRTNDPTDNTFLIAVTSTGATNPGQLFRGTRLNSIQEIILDPDTQYYPALTAVANKTGTTTWFAAGIANIGGIRVGLVKSTDDGLTWDFSNATAISTGGQELQSRDLNGQFVGYADSNAPYLRNCVALRYSSDASVWMAGGAYNVDNPVMVRSTNDGSNWTTVTGEFVQECANYSLDNSSIWIATGSSGYKTLDFSLGVGTFTAGTDTIKYSTDQGQTWYNASNAFNVFGYEVVYANGTWLATGVTATPNEDEDGFYFAPELRYSTNGVNWIRADLTDTIFNQFNPQISNSLAPLRLGSLNFDGTYWNVFVNEETPEDGRVRLYRHDTTSDLETDWFSVDISGSLVSGNPEQNSNTRFLQLRNPKYLYTGQPPSRIQLSINTNIGNGPTFTSPITTSYFLYQYMPITPIQLSASGVGQVYFFLETADLPPGLNYNQTTNEITGAPVRLGQDSVTIYAKDNNGTTTRTLTFTTVVPRVIRKQDGAGAFTSLLRQYTEVLGAQNARDNRVLPNQERALGEFMSPEAPDVITQTIDPKCRNPNC